MRRSAALYYAAFVALLAVGACSQQRKVRELGRSAPTATLTLPERSAVPDIGDLSLEPVRDTLEVYDFEGHRVTVMNAVRDGSGDMVAHDVLNAAVVTARFRNVAERHGKVDLEFQVIVPRQMLERDWQTRFYPDMFILEDSVRLDMLMLTGCDYRKKQLKGYQHYNNFLASIVADTTRFINLHLLEIFLQRNIPQVYAFKTDSTARSDEEFTSCFGVTERQAVEHYTNKIARHLNERRKRKIGQMYRRYVKAPIVTDGVRLDTVFTDVNGDFVYNYVQTIATRPRLRKVDIVLSGEIYEQDLLLYTVPRSEPLTFYISSLSAFADNTERYLTKVVERRVAVGESSNIVFEAGRADVRPYLGGNAAEIRRIKDCLLDILQDEKFDLDSITVRSWASPEGSVAFNRSLADRRAASCVAYFNDFVKHMRDSLRRERGFSIVVGGDESMRGATFANVSFRTATGGENWAALDTLVRAVTAMTEADREAYFALAGMRNADEREAKMRGMPSYPYIRENLYPSVRTVDFGFHLHRKGMVKDTVHTTELDETYMRGVQAIRDRDYEAACVLLAPYRDYNSAVAYLAADRNMTALQLLEDMERTPRVCYMLAILYSRLGDEQRAVQSYNDARAADRTYVSRGNLDPEISGLIKKYELNRKFFEEEE